MQPPGKLLKKLIRGSSPRVLAKALHTRRHWLDYNPFTTSSEDGGEKS
jgi:hypothetical protein